jgi:hypothetical protein
MQCPSTAQQPLDKDHTHNAYITCKHKLLSVTETIQRMLNKMVINRSTLLKRIIRKLNTAGHKRRNTKKKVT